MFRRIAQGVVLLFSVTVFAACGDSAAPECPLGSENCACTAGGGCDPGLTCLSDVCTEAGPDEDGAAGDADGGIADDGGLPDGTDDGGYVDDRDDAGMPDAADDGGLVDAGDEGGVPDAGGDDGGTTTVPPSCDGMIGDECGGESCCATLAVPGGWFAMGRGEAASCPTTPSAGSNCTATTTTCLEGSTTWGCPDGTWIELGGDDRYDRPETDETPEHAALVGGFKLDKYEVTVGRMRRFFEAYDKGALLQLLAAGAGAHPDVIGSGWSAGWDDYLPDLPGNLEEALQCNDPSQTWTASAGANETFPINCLSYYLAYAFCAWDGGRLPTEAEWEYAATGGDQNRLYPWGDANPTGSLANYLGSDNTSFQDVFAKPDGAGRWGHQALGGSMWEWVLDLHDPGWYGNGGSDCRDCANLSAGTARTMRGGNWQYPDYSLRAAERFPGSAGSYWLGSSVRCARDD